MTSLRAELEQRPGARGELAALYRELGHPDQAGRWGIALDGWVTSRERAAFTAMVRAEGFDPEDALRRLSRLSDDAELTPDAVAVISEVTRSRPARREPNGWRAQVDIVSRLVSGGILAMGIGVFVIMPAMFFVALFAGEDDLTLGARVSATVGALLVAVAAVIRLPASVIRGQWVRVGLLCVVALALGAFFVPMLESPGLWFSD